MVPERVVTEAVPSAALVRSLVDPSGERSANFGCPVGPHQLPAPSPSPENSTEMDLASMDPAEMDPAEVDTDEAREFLELFYTETAQEIPFEQRLR